MGVYSYFPGFSKSCSECSPPVVLSRMTVDDETSPILTFSETKKWLQHPDVPPPQRNWTSHFNTISSFFLEEMDALVATAYLLGSGYTGSIISSSLWLFKSRIL